MELIYKVVEAVYAPINATQNVFDGTNTIFSMVGVFVLIAIAAGILALLFTMSRDIKKYRRFTKLLKSLSKMFSYCAFGMLTVAVVAFPVYLGYLGINSASENPEGAIEVGKWIGIVVGAFIGFTLVGYCTKNRIWKRLWKFHKEEKQLKETMEELPGMIN